MSPLYKQHIISINDLTRKDLEFLLTIAFKLKNEPQKKLLKNKIIAICFFEASTRTRLSFEAATYRLGASIIGFSDANNTSLVKKGETLVDTISVIKTYVDAIIIRHPQEGSARLVSKFSGKIPIINAGDGSNQHPTQTLLDLFTIFETQNRLDYLNIAITGDLKYGRTVHSLTQALSIFNGNRFYFISSPELCMPQYILSMLKEKNITYTIHNNIEDILSEVDILYMTRIQRERLNSSEYDNIKTNLVLHVTDLHHVRKNFKILHPLPRLNEIDIEVDQTPYAYYFQQAGNGIFARQAILASVLDSNLLVELTI